VPALLEIAAAHDGERVLAVTHGGPIRAAFAFAGAMTYAQARVNGPAIGNAFVAEFAVEGGLLRQLD
jgi:broad specificity phosphatase PhoE